MNLSPIKNEQQYDDALTRVDTLMDSSPEPGTPESDELEILVMLIEKYEEEHWRIEEPDPIEAIKVRMAQMHLDRKDLKPYIGSKGKVSDVLNRKAGLSLAMIAKLSEALSLSADLLMKASSWHFNQNRRNPA